MPSVEGRAGEVWFVPVFSKGEGISIKSSIGGRAVKMCFVSVVDWFPLSVESKRVTSSSEISTGDGVLTDFTEESIGKEGNQQETRPTGLLA